MTAELPIPALHAINRLDLVPTYYHKKTDSWSTTTKVNIVTNFTQDELVAMKEACYAVMKSSSDSSSRNAAATGYQGLTMALRLMSDVEQFNVTTNDSLVAAIKAVMIKKKTQWLWLTFNDGNYVPVFVYDIVSKPRQRDDSSHVIVSVAWRMPGSAAVHTKGIVFYREDINPSAEDAASGAGDDDDDDGSDDDDESPKKSKRAKKSKAVTVVDILTRRNIFFGSDDAIKDHEQCLATLGDLPTRIGARLLGRGMAFYSDEKSSTYYRSSKCLQVDAEGTPSRLVVDRVKLKANGAEDSAEPNYFIHSWWRNSNSDSEVTGSFWGSNKRPNIPVHPYVRAYDLVKHMPMLIHISGVTRCVPNTGLKDKLVLPQRDSDFIDLLMGSAGHRLEDIVIGKTGGVIIMCSGDPGTGKTLTAEVYSEVMDRALLTVQASQLGTDEEKLEERLQAVLHKAERWNAILMIDEADVYVRERGTDIQQNAIVGVFLRLLEYYHGVMFLTTNKPVEVDDAIISRLTAHIRYSKADGAMLVKLWMVLSKQYGVELTTDDIAALTTKWPKLSGRSIKNLLKLTNFVIKSPTNDPSEPIVNKILKSSVYLDGLAD